eukprot:2528304-Pleurochrysis_carterae.AAC.1
MPLPQPCSALSAQRSTSRPFFLCASRNLGFKRSTYTYPDCLTELIVAPLTASLCSEGIFGVVANGFQIDLVPFPRTQSVVPSYAPVVSTVNAYLTEMLLSAFVHASITCGADARRGHSYTLASSLRSSCFAYANA